MKQKMIKFPSIEALANVYLEIKHKTRFIERDDNDYPIYDESIKLPVIDYNGFTKIHGSNGGIVITKDDIYCQSRKNVLSLMVDNANFFKFVNKRKQSGVLRELVKDIEFNEEIVIFGEYAGEGIQRGMGVNQVEKFFVIFKCKVDGKWMDN